MNKKSKIIILSILILLTMSTLLYVSYGYLVTKVEGNNTSKTLSTIAKILEIEYSGGNESLSSDGEYFIPGTTLEKKFTLKNYKKNVSEIGRAKVNFKISLIDITNDFEREEDLKYELYRENELINSDIFPKENVVIAYNQTINVGESVNYTLKVYYDNTEDNQIIDQGKIIKAKLNFEQEESISNIRILGNSILDETTNEMQSVGDKTTNIFDGIFKYGIINSNNGVSSESSTPKSQIFTLNYIPITPNTSYTMVNSICNLNQKVRFYDIDKKYIGYNFKSGGWLAQTASGLVRTGKTPDNAYYVKFEMDFNDVDTATAVLNGNYKLSLNKDTSITIYEPYNKYKIPLSLIGKNKWNSDYWLGLSNDTLKNMSTLINVNDNIQVTVIPLGLKKGTYTFSTINNTIQEGESYGLYDILDGEVISRKQIYKNNKWVDCQLIDVTGELYIGSWDNNAAINAQPINAIKSLANSNTQIELGDRATNYEKYNKTNYNIYLDEPLRKIDDYQDYIDFKTKKIVRNVEVIDINGTRTLKGLETPIYEDNEYIPFISKIIPYYDYELISTVPGELIIE